jgi:anti-sigma regulatory factor (Ser/Thr protein kinase)
VYEPGWVQTVPLTARLMTTARLAARREAPAQARALVATALADWRCDKLVDVAQLLVSELVTNVVLHAGGEAEVSIALHDRCLRIEVADSSPVMPTQRERDDGRVGGRGLPIIEVVGDRWGVEPRDGGKVVWAELVVA